MRVIRDYWWVLLVFVGVLLLVAHLRPHGLPRQRKALPF